MPILKTPRRLRPDDKLTVTSLVSLLTAGEDPRPRVDFENLSQGEAVELVELSERIRTGEAEQSDPKFWRLVEKSSALEAGHFERRAGEAKAARKEAERSARERRMPFTRGQGTSLLLALHEALAADDLWTDDAIVVLLVAMQFVSGKPLISTSTIEGSATSGDLTLTLSIHSGLAPGSDWSAATAGWPARVRHLCEEGWLEDVAGRGPVRRLRMGPKLRALVDLAPGVPS